MGIFANFFTGEDSFIPEEKKAEFVSRLERIFQAGGMMDIEEVQLYGKRIWTIQKARMKENGMNCIYNYYEDDFWENAGFSNKRQRVYSGKLGWRQFREVVLAAYALQELYTKGIAGTIVNGRPITNWVYVGWINYLFKENNHIKNFDPWPLYEALHEDEKDYCEGPYDFGESRYAFIGECEIWAVENGVKAAVEEFKTRDKGAKEQIVWEKMRDLLEELDRFADESKMSKEEQIETLLDIVHRYYEAPEKEGSNIIYDKGNEEMLRSVLMTWYLTDSPVFLLKAIAEKYEKDFWDLWEQVKEVACRKQEALYGNKGYYVLYFSTVDFLQQSPDDMIPYWEEGGDLEFSSELESWFTELREKYDLLVKDAFAVEKPLNYYLELMEEADQNYYQIYTFSDFWEDSLNNLNDQRYHALWKIYEDMLRDPELKKAGDVIFISDEEEEKRKSSLLWRDEEKRHLRTNWTFLPLNEQKNAARVAYRRYMALMGNRELRKKIFGI